VGAASALYVGPVSLAAELADPAVIESSNLAIRVRENQTPGTSYMVWSFEAGTALEEIVFEGFAGEWRIWEIRFGPAERSLS
jgi:hypothetical protein